MAISIKHPWEYKQQAITSKSTKEEFEELVKRASAKNEKEIKSSGYMTIDGIPHKFKNGTWIALTKMS